MNVNYINKSDNAEPKYAYDGDSGFDVMAWITSDENDTYVNAKGKRCITLKPMERRLIHTGLYVQIPPNCEMQIRTRSGLALKQGLIVLNSPATIDSNYTGESRVLMANMSNEDIEVFSGERIAQFVIAPVFGQSQVELNKVEDFTIETTRGDKGYGSSGID